MSREKKFFLNTVSALLYQVITTSCSFILPLFVIPYFGSSINGLINSITQFLTVITLCECGVGAVVQSALYKPLATKNNKEISKILSSANKFFNSIMKILIIYIFILIVIYPTFIIKSDNIFFVSSLIVIMSAGFMIQYYLYLPYRLLLNADQISYIQLFVYSVILILNTIFTIILIKLNSSIHLIKIMNALIFLIQPLIVKYYVKKNYELDLSIEYTNEPIKQKWNGLAQHISSSMLENTDTVIITIFLSLKSVSVYGVYYLIVHGIRQVIVSLSTGIQSLIGEMLAKNETENLNKVVSYIEIIFHYIVTLLFFLTGVLIIPFIKIYTANFNDTNYMLPIFSIFMTLSQAAYCIRLPYEIIIRAAGHYRETQKSSIMEAILNVVFSIFFVIILPEKFKISGVAIGTIIAVMYRTIYLTHYLSKKILKRDLKNFLFNIGVDLISIIFMYLATSKLPKYDNNYLTWFSSAILNGLMCLVVSGVVNFVAYKKTIIKIINLKKEGKRKYEN